MLFFFFYHDSATTKIYTLSLHDALPIYYLTKPVTAKAIHELMERHLPYNYKRRNLRDRKSTRLNSSHMSISYAVFCLKKKTNQESCSYPVNHFSLIT